MIELSNNAANQVSNIDRRRRHAKTILLSLPIERLNNILCNLLSSQMRHSAGNAFLLAERAMRETPGAMYSALVPEKSLKSKKNWREGYEWLNLQMTRSMLERF
jgi:hypothetical protein